jgi:hypothetical protein
MASDPHFATGAERTNFPREVVAEAAPAHVVGDRTEAAYRRGDLFEKHRGLMESWAAHCLTKTGASNWPLMIGIYHQ